MIDYKKIVDDFKKGNGISFDYSTDMPEGYEEAYGTFDIEKKTLFFNSDYIKRENCSDEEAVFFLFHELRHSLQYNKPFLFDDRIRESLPYVILYNGTAYKFKDGVFRECFLDKDETFLSNAYLSLPYEADANSFAYKEALSLFPERKESLDSLYSSWLCDSPIPYEKLKEIYREIDGLV